jgi:putative methyltransferase
MKEKYNFTASLETNRGCPYQCYYCDWGNHKVTNKKMRLFNEDRVNAEIEWFGKNKIDFVFGCDSNYGFYGKRDMKFIDEIIETKKTYGFPNKFRVCYTKNSDETIFKMNKKLNEFNLSKGATISFQSFNKQTLKAVKRKNMGIQDFQKYILMYNKENIPVYTELILGLPEETYESFKEGFNILLNNMQHSNIVVYYCQVLENSKLNEKEYKEKYDIKISKIPMYATHTKFEKDQIFEYENIVVKTEKMFRTDWVWSCMFSWSVQTFHCLGLTQYIAIHLKYVYGIEYKDFYTNLIYLEFNNSINLIKNEYFKVMHIFNQVAVEKGSFKYIVDDINWPIEEGSFLHFIDNFDLFYLEIVEFLFKKYPEIAKNKEITELINFNKYMLCKYNDKIFHMKMNYSFVDIFEKYFETGKYEFEECKNRTYYPATKKYKNFKDFAINVVWYGRKGGKTFKNLNDIKVEYIK